MENNFLNSELNRLIPPEIKNDELYFAIHKIAREEDIKTVLEIGSSSGQGSTEAFVTGLRENPNQPTLFCMEISKPRFTELQNTYRNDSFVKCYNVSSVSIEQFSDEEEVIKFYRNNQTNLNYYPLEQVLGWLCQDIEYLNTSGVLGNGIKEIKKQNDIDIFDAVLIDGSEFTGSAELEEVYGAKIIILDDINTFKNYRNHNKLVTDPNYVLVAQNYLIRNGYAIFKKNTFISVNKSPTQSAVESYLSCTQEPTIYFNFKTEKSEQLLVKNIVRLGMVVFDVGANIGDYSILFSQLVGNCGKVYSFEPTGNIFIKLQERVKEYGCQNISLFQNAIFSQNKLIEFNEFPDEYSVWNSIGKPKMMNPEDQNQYVPIVKIEMIEAITLDSFCQMYQIEFIDYLKLDVEGAESDALEGAIGLLTKKAIRFIQFEISQKMLEGLNRQAQETFDLLIKAGYECNRIKEDGKIGEQVIGSTSFYENYIAFPALPIHFFTIVLNGLPFIKYHIEAFKQLPFKWHWHIIEGVADLKHDTAWSLRNGGRITDEIHSKGRSNDGTAEYLDELAQLYPENVTVYRKPEGIFWEGKREMVNAPLENINQECLLWQLDADELWTAEQICTARQMFINHPEKTAAFYWCWYFVGENLVISTRNCYAQNPQQDWLRTWRFKPGAFWASHEPPRLVEVLPNSECRDVAAVNPFLHEETEKQGLVFQHFAYVTLEQLRFKELYYGYKNAVYEWSTLQLETKWPVRLGNYLSWVQDGTMVDKAESFGVAPIAQRDKDNNVWRFVQPEELLRQKVVPKVIPRIIVDGVFFQLYNTGIARVWRSLLEEWVTQDFAQHIIVLDRAGTAPKIPGIAYCPVPAYDYEKTDSDREMLQQVCDELEADLFISTYYTTPLSTPSIFIAYDMTPEVFETNLDEPMWREKHYGIRHASAYITISHNTASDLLKFFPDIAPELVTVAHCGVPKNLSPASPEEIESFKIKYNLSKPYFMMVGAAGGHKNAPLFLQAFAQLPNQPEFDIVCTFHSALTKDEYEPYTSGSTVHKLHLSDEELKAAFSGAVALVYPSQYEGFGLPILEAMACGCPVITCPNASIPEVAGEAALYVPDDDVEAMAIALVNIQQPEVRESLIAAGIEQAKKFSWSRMAKTVSSVFIKVFQEKQSMLIRQENSQKLLPERDYISPGFAIVLPDECFPNMIVGDTGLQPWPYLRREVPHNWYVDKRHPTVGFLSRDEAHILYNTALKFKGKKALEIGCWLGWSACHLALAGVKLEIVDPLLARPDFYESVRNSLQAAGVLDSIRLVAGYSPQAVEELAAQLQTKWSLIFIDGNHEAPGPLNDAIICEQLAAQDALILFHDLAAPAVAQGLDYFKQKGWQTMVYQTMQIMGVAWRGNVEPVIHLPDPKVNWVLPAHLQNYTVSGMSNQFLDREVAVRQVQEMMQQAVALLNSNKPVEAMRIAEQAASLNINVPGMHYLRSVCLSNVGRHKEALAAAKAELAIDPTHRQAQKQVESLTKAILRSPIKIPTQQRSWNTTLARENMLSIQNATMNYSYRGVPMLKNPFDFALYPLLIWNLKPRTIIEIGSKDGGSAVWLGDMLNNFGIDGHIYSIDIVEVTSVQHPRVTYMEGNGRALQEILTPGFINSLPRPLLVIEDADHSYETSKHVLEFFHPYLKLEEYIVIEDGIISDLVQDASYNSGPHKALKEFLSEHEDEYEIDSSYCDYFGYNMTWCTNGFLKKVKESSSLGEPFLNKLFHYVEEYQPASQVGSSVDLSGDRQKLAQLIQKGKECFVKGEIETAIATFTQALEVHQSSLIAHNYLTSLYWQVGDVQQSLQHHIQAQFRNIAFDNTLTDEFQEILSVIRPYTLLSEARLFSLYSLARQICLDDIPGNFVECGSCKGGSAALLAVVIKRYSLRPRLVYAFDTFEGMPEPTEADKHNGIPANLTDWGAGTLKAPLTDNLDVICQSLDVGDIVIAVKGLFAQTLPESKSEIGSIALLHADGDWYESTMDIFNNIYDRVVPNGFIQIDDYGHWEGCKKAIHEFERGCGQSFALRVIDYTGVWFQKEDSVHQDCNHWRTFWHLAQASEKMGNIELAKKAAQAVLKIVPKLVKAENLLNRDRSQLELVVSPEVSLSAELDDFLNNLRLREINLILFPDWQQPEESLCLQLEGVMTALLAHKEPSKITALLDTSNISEEDANLVLSSVIMNILMQEDLDETDVPEVSLLGTLSEMQWKALLPCIHYRVVLENENQQAVAQAGAASLPSLEAANLSI